MLASLSFTQNQQVISVVSGLSLSALQSSIGPSISASLAVPLPSVSLNNGPTAVYPANRLGLALFARLGSVFPVDSPALFQAVCAVTGTIAAFYSLAGTTAGWLAESGLAPDRASIYVAAMLSGMFTNTPGVPALDFSALAQEHMTQGGLNDEFLGRLTACGAQDMFADGLTALGQRLLSSTAAKE